MYSDLDLFTLFIISLLYVGIFRIQRRLTPLKYFSNADIVIRESVSYFQIIIRYLLIGIFSISLNFLFGINNDVILLGNFLGAFLIIWPTLLTPKYSDESFISEKNKKLIYFLHLLFVITTVLATWGSLALYPMFVEDTSDYIIDVLISGGSLVFGDYVKRKLSKKILINRKEDEKEYDDMVDED